jgi:diguanylate cyclase (GGDEF)-like protein
MATSTPSEPIYPQVSLRRRFFWMLIGVVILFTAGMALSVAFSFYANKTAEERLLQAEAKQMQANVIWRWEYYQVVVANLARDPQLIDLMRVGSVDDLQEWAESRQRLLPGILGFALTDPQGAIYGDADLLRVGPLCRRELKNKTPAPLNHVLTHRDVPGLEHFDVVAEIFGPGGELLGKVFASVRARQMQKILEDAARPGQVISLRDAADNLVASSGTMQKTGHEVRVALPTMGWTLVVQSPIQRFNRGGAMQILAGLLTLLCVLILLVVMVMRLRRPVLHDIDAVRDALSCLTRDESAPPIVARYVEFAPVAEDINRIALHLHEQRMRLEHLSLTDPLTSLPNRRAFETRFPQMLGLAKRGHPIALVLLDVDHFKSINDRFGHGVGDQALLGLAQALKDLTRRADLASRLAGDEFVVLLSELDSAGVDAWYQRLSDRFRNELGLLGLDVQTGLSAGQTWLGSVDNDSMNDALARADHALYRAKALGRGQLVQEATPAPGTPE